MEERIMDEDELRGIKKRREGDAPEDGQSLAYELTGEDGAAEDGYDEDLVGLTPSQLQEELARREKQRAEAHAESLRYRESSRSGC